MFRLAPRQAHLRKGEGPHSVAQWPPLGSQRGRADWPGGPRRPGIRVLGGQGMTPQEEQCVPPTVLASPLSTSPAPCLPPQLQQVHSALLLPTSLCCLRNRMLLLLSRYIVSHSFVTQAPLSMEFSRQAYWSRVPFPPPGSSWPRDGTLVSCISHNSRWILSHDTTFLPLFFCIFFLKTYLKICIHIFLSLLLKCKFLLFQCNLPFIFFNFLILYCC